MTMRLERLRVKLMKMMRAMMRKIRYSLLTSWECSWSCTRPYTLVPRAGIPVPALGVPAQPEPGGCGSGVLPGGPHRHLGGAPHSVIHLRGS